MSIVKTVVSDLYWRNSPTLATGAWFAYRLANVVIAPHTRPGCAADRTSTNRVVAIEPKNPTYIANPSRPRGQNATTIE